MHTRLTRENEQKYDFSIWRVSGDPLLPATHDETTLGGLRLAVKDLFAVAGQPVGAGNPRYLTQASLESATAPAVQKLLDAGASLQGIAQTDEFAYSIAGLNEHYGAPRNGANPRLIPGGSSSGSASAVALGLADVGVGTDTAGSIRVPASYQGLWGLRTTHGLVPRDGVLPLAPSFDTVGWLTRDSETLTTVAALFCPETELDDSAVFISEDFLELCDAEIRDQFEKRVAASFPQVKRFRLAEAGIESPARLYEIFRLVQCGEAWDAWGEWMEQNLDVVGKDVAARFTAARDADREEIAQARVDFERQRAAIREFATGKLLALPTVPGAAPALEAGPDVVQETRAKTLSLTAFAGVGGLPGLSVPYLDTVTPAGRAPVGLCLVGPQASERALIAAAQRRLYA